MILILSDQVDITTDKVVEWLIHYKAPFLRINEYDNIVLYFWWSMCAPCIKEMPLLTELKKRNCQIISFCKNSSENEKVEELMSKYKSLNPTYIGGNDHVGEIFNQGGFPHIILFEQGKNYPEYFRNIEGVLEYLYKSQK